MKYLVVNDPHLDIYAPSSRRLDDYMASCLRKLTAIRDLCAEYQVDALVCTGDWFHKKNPQGVPHRLVRPLLEWAHTLTGPMGIPILTTLGNHDVQFNDMSWESVCKQPVSLLLEVPGVVLLSQQDTWFGKDGVVFAGCSYRPDRMRDNGTMEVDPSQFDMPTMFSSEGHFVVQVTHASVLPEPTMWTHILASEVAALSRADVCHTGHIHEDLGIHCYTRADGSPFWWTNVGSMTRGSLTELTISREPKVLLVEAFAGEAPKFKQLVLPHQPVEQIYDVDGYREAKIQNKAFSAWTSQLQQELHATASEEASLETLVHQSLLDPPARDLAFRLLNDAGA